MGAELEDYVARLPVPVTVLRTGERVGLIRARLKGAQAARGDVLLFLDAHCETTPGWLEPLLARGVIQPTFSHPIVQGCPKMTARLCELTPSMVASSRNLADVFGT